MIPTRKSDIYHISSKTVSTNMTETTKDEIVNDGKKPCLGYRHVMVFIGFWAIFFPTAHRLAFSVTIVAMVNYTSSYQELRSSNSVCLTNTTISSLSKPNVGGEFNWSSEIQGYILGLNFLGIIIFRFTAGKFIEMWGEKRILLLGNIMGSFLMFVSPFASWYHEYALMVIQFLRGATESIILPCVYATMGKWHPPLERGLYSTLVVTGYSFGGAFGGMFAGWICDLPGFGWPYVFYLSGALNLPLVVFVFFCFRERPENHPHISAYELNLILDCKEISSSKKALSTPWKAIFTSVPVYALIIGNFGVYWISAVCQIVLPTFMSTILHFGMTENGILSCFPHILRSISTILTSLISTWLQKKKYVGVDKLRKGCSSIGSVLYCGCFLGVYFAKCDTTVNVIFFTLSFICFGIAFGGSAIAFLDMSPNFAGSLTGFAVGIGSISTFIVPIMVGKITVHQTLEEWHQVFFICIGVLIFCAIVFQYFGSAEVQPWNSTEYQKKEKVQTDTNVGEKKL